MALLRLPRVLLVACLAGPGCAGARAPRPAAACSLPVTIALQPSERSNPDEHGRALPTVVRLLQLRGATRLAQADFDALWERPEATLDDELVHAQALTVFPGQPTRVPLALDPHTRFLAGVAIFRQPVGTQWRALVALPAVTQRCAAKPVGAAVDFALDGHRIEARSHLLSPRDGRALPSEVTAGSEQARPAPDARR